MAPKRRTTRLNPDATPTPVTDTHTTTSVTNAQIQAMTNEGVTAALAACDATRNGDDSHTSGTGVRRPVQVARECTYPDFLKCQPLNFKGTEGVVRLTQHCSPGINDHPMMQIDPYAYIMAAYEVPPSPDYIPGPEVPPSPDYIPGPEEPQSPPPLDFVPEPMYPEYMPQEDEILPAEATTNLLLRLHPLQFTQGICS
ncbi:hypothetical protein Tco_1404564 [Tanacetum coccineum]